MSTTSAGTRDELFYGAARREVGLQDPAQQWALLPCRVGAQRALPEPRPDSGRAAPGPARVHGRHELVRYGQVPIAVLLASAPDAAAMVAQAVLGPVLALPAVEYDILLGTLRMWFGEQGATSVAAAKLHVHRNTVRYRLRRLEDLTGRNLSQPTGIAELHLALEATRILHLQGAPANGA